MKESKQKSIQFLNLTIKNHPLFKKNTNFSLINDGRVNFDRTEELTNLFGRVWLNNLVMIIGKNATGKTTIMKTVIGVLSFLLEGLSIDQTTLKDILIGSDPIDFEAYFYGSDGYIYKDEFSFEFDSLEHEWHVASEKIYQKRINKSISKRRLLDFNDDHLILNRNRLTEMEATLLANDDSIFRSVLAKHKYQKQSVINTLMFTNINALFYRNEKVPGEILEFLDPSIEYLHVEDKVLDGKHTFIYRLKFKNNSEVFTESNFEIIQHYLSSGTAKGITLYGNVLRALRTGGIIFIDELENHFNHAIVKSFIEYFSDPKLNPNRATLVFSTHYSELLDDLDRGDEIYIAKREKTIELQRYSKAKVRKDLVKSEVYDSDYLGGTAPRYEAYMKLKKATGKEVNE